MSNFDLFLIYFNLVLLNIYVIYQCFDWLKEHKDKKKRKKRKKVDCNENKPG